MRILHLASSHRWTGVAEPAAELARAQRELGHEVAFACIGGESFMRRLRERDIPFAEGFQFKSGLRPFGMIGDVRRLRRLARKRRFDVIHAHLPHDHWIGAAALRVSRHAGGETAISRPILVRTLHSPDLPREDFLHRRLFKSATDMTVAISREGREAAIERLDLEPARVVRIGGAVDLERFHPDIDPAMNRNLWSIPHDAPVAGMVARMRPERGHLDFIDTIGEVLRSTPEARYVIAGRGELKKPIRALARDHAHGERLIQAGYRKTDLPETYAALDVSVLLAAGTDGSCRAMLEAMACGRPVIGVDRGAMADTIEPGKTGWLVDLDKDPASLTRALIEALGDRERCREMGRAAREQMEEGYSQRSRAERTLAAYRVALQRQRPA